MAKRAPTIERDGSRVTVIACSAEDAMAAAGDAAPGFRTISMDTVRRGGIAGFFTTEMVRLVAETGPRPPGGLELATADDLIASLRAGASPFADRLADGLQRSLLAPRDEPAETATSSPREPAAPAAPRIAGPAASLRAVPTLGPTASASAPSSHIPATPDAPSPTPAVAVALRPEAAPSTVPAGGAWSVAALRAVGMPDELMAEIARYAPDCEVTWNVALLMALRDRCGGDLPANAVLAGPACADLAQRLHVAAIRPDELADAAGQVALPDASLAQLADLGGRPLHLVVGGVWRHLGTLRPAVVSAASPADLVDAVRVAIAWDVPLGWLVGDDGPVRIDPFVVAGHLRSVLGGTPPRPARRAARTNRASRAS